MIAEDNPALLRVTRFALERAGFSVLAAADGDQALTALRKDDGRVGMLITDQQMPKLTGLELIAAVRQMPRFASLPVVLLTAKALELSHERVSDELGVARVLGKPFSPLEVARIVADLMPGTPSRVT
ncbi:MAG: response regulator [Planctomycetota bacterium]